MNIEPIILGDNQFFGINHISEKKGITRGNQFKDISEIKKIIKAAADNGVNAVSFSTHPAVYRITDMLKSDPVLKNLITVYPNIPYLMKYVSMLTQIGPVKTVKKTLKGNSPFTALKYSLAGAFNIVSNDYFSLLKKVIDIELAPFKGLNIKGIFLHNGITDLALGLGLTNIFTFFDAYIRHEFNAIPGYGTQNFSVLCDTLEKAGIENSLIMASFNKKGFIMNPSKKVCEKRLESSKNVTVAMATLASGNIPPEEAYDYLFNNTAVKHVIVGLSTAEHASKTFGIIKKYMKLK